jgi:GNAT superfamily N-acetyltransferase
MEYRARAANLNDLEDCRRVAEMFNDFDSAWPDGFTRGIQETAEHIRETLGRRRILTHLVAERGEEFVGYCNLEAAAGQTEVAYIDLLGARLSHHGKGVGKMLLREMVRRVTDFGYRQVTLYTWAGNTKAVPLYKKTGFHWVPDTDVFMRNYLPSLLNSPMGKAFFANRDWYECHERSLEIAPDDVTWKGMKVYPYRFRDGDDFLNATYDANAHGLTAIETPTYAIACYVPVEEAPAGETFPITWEFQSRNGEPLEIVLLTETDPSLEVSVQERLLVQGATTLTRSLRVSPDATPRSSGETAHRVRSTLLVNGQPIVLETGVKVVRPVEILYGGQLLFTGQEETIDVVLLSHLDRPLSGQLALEPHPSLICEAPAQPFTLEPRLRTERCFRVTAREAGVLATQLRYTAGETQGGRPVIFRALNGSGTLASVEPNYAERGVLESPGLRVEANLRGGFLELHHPTLKRGLMGQPMAELGPPFVAWRQIEPLLPARVDTNGPTPALVVAAPSKEFPGLTVERSVTQLGGEAVRVDYRVFNTANHAQPAQLKFNTHAWIGRYLAAPTPQGLLREPLFGWGDFLEGDTDLLAHNAVFTENWMAFEEESLVCGLVWSGAPKLEMGWERFPYLIYDLGELPPHAARALPPVYLIGGAGSWETVRAWWRRLVQPYEGVEEPAPEPKRVLEVVTEPSPALLTGDLAEVPLTVFNRRGRAVEGTLTLASETVFRAAPETFVLDKVDRDRPFTATVQITGPQTPAAGLIKATVTGGPNVDSFWLPVVRISVGETLDIVEAESGVYTMENGYFTLRIAPAFHGSMIALERGGVNQLFSSYPEARPFRWVNPWYGGVHPGLGEVYGDRDLAQETFTGEPVERVGERGLRWQGVRVACEPTHKDRRWLRFEAEYLTLPGSNVVALITRWTNKQPARMETSGGFAVWGQPGGARDNTVGSWLRGEERRERRPGGFEAEMTPTPWAALENPATGDCLLLVAAASRTRVALHDDGEEGRHLCVHGGLTLGPNETRERLAWLVHLTEGGQLDAYAGLVKRRTLP